MDMFINHEELEAMSGLPHLQQLAYLRGIRPYMDVKTGLVGLKRGISYQSIAEQLYIEPHQGIKSETCSRMQVRRALSALTRAGLITSQSQGLTLILKCEIATRGYSVQNKVDLKPTQQADIANKSQCLVNKERFEGEAQKADLAKTAKADTPLKDNNYIYLLSQFEKFWSVYPEKKSKQATWEIFQQLNPDVVLVNTILQALENQIKNREAKQFGGEWVPPWKYPATWLTKACWEDEITLNLIQEKPHATHRKNTRNEPAKDIFWCGEAEDHEHQTNVVPFKRHQ